MSPRKRNFTKKSRLLTRKDFQRVFRTGKKSSDHLFTVIACSNNQSIPRMGLAISRKCSKRAVDRNRLKRIARECFRSIQEDIAQIDLVVIGRPDSKHAGNDKLRSSLLGHFTRLNRLYAKFDNHTA